MIISLLILCAMVLIFGFFFRAISMSKASTLRALETQRQIITGKYEYLREHKKELSSELTDKERKLASMRNAQEGIKTFSARELNIDDSANSADDKISRYLIQKGKINLEQNEKVLQKMGTLHMDFLGTCLTLGFIDLETAKKTLKVTKLTSKLGQ